MKHIKRIAALVLALTMSLSLAACGKTGSGAQSGEEQITLTIGIPNKVNVLDWEDNEFTKWVEETTGYNLEFKFFASDFGEAKSQLTTMMAGGEKLPDLILNLLLDPEDRDRFGHEGYFVDLNTYFQDEEFMANYDWDESVEKNLSEDMKNRLTVEMCDLEGHMYAFPRVMSATFDTPGDSMYVNKTWLDKLGLEMPTNLDEMKEVAIAFMTQDPNDNGQADEIPMLGRINKSSKSNILAWLMDNYCLGYRDFYTIDGDGKVFFSWTTDEYREGLKKIREFYDEGLLSELVWTMQSSSEMASATSPADGVAKVGFICSAATSWATANTPLLDEYVPLPPFEGSHAYTSPIVLGTAYNFITTDCENPDAAMDLLLTIATPEGVRRQRYGVPDVDWVWAENYDDGMRGLKILNPDAYTGQTKQTWAQETSRLSWFTSVEDEKAGLKDPTTAITIIAEAPEDRNWADRRTALHRHHADLYLEVAARSEHEERGLTYVPPMTNEQNNELSPMEYALKDYRETMRAKFCVGEIDVNDDAVWQDYLNNVQKLGAERCLEIKQETYDNSQAMLKN